MKRISPKSHVSVDHGGGKGGRCSAIPDSSPKPLVEAETRYFVDAENGWEGGTAPATEAQALIPPPNFDTFQRNAGPGPQLLPEAVTRV
ncbi:hypothetical protein VTI28DRAFT_3759 [Corynascus sepedonium]